MKLYIAEKPSVARAIGDALGDFYSRDGYLENDSGDKITWCFGHLLELKQPVEYDEKNNNWSFESLPFQGVDWSLKVKKDSSQQFNVVKSLIKTSSILIHAGDPDAEGQLLVDEIIDHVGYKGEVSRVLINDNHPDVIRKSIKQLKSNSDFKGLSNSALARSRADWWFGLHMSRAFTIKAKSKDVLSVGRVQTPILGLVVNRTLENKSHKKSFYYVLSSSGAGTKWKIEFPSNAPLDNKKLIRDQSYLNDIQDKINEKKAIITSRETKETKENAPLCYNLLDLQAHASKTLNLRPDSLLEITQKLKDKGLITYNRSDCNYLSEEQHKDAPKVLEAISSNLGALTIPLDANFKGRIYNSKKITAHHAIIPTFKKSDFDTLSSELKAVYEMIALRFRLQFLPPARFEVTKFIAECEGYTFTTSTKNQLELGWQALVEEEKNNEDEDEDEKTATKLDLCIGDQFELTANVIKKETTPKPLFTMETLLKELTRVAQYVENEELKQAWINKDKDIKELGGIGTPATRSVIIENLFKRNFIKEENNKIIATDLGAEFFKSLPEKISSPSLCATWHLKQALIQENESTVEDFVLEVQDLVQEQLNDIQAKEFNLTSIEQREVYPCIECKKPMLRFKSKTGKGFWWGCSGFKETGCRCTAEDVKGKPKFKKNYPCPNCCKPLIKRPSKDKKTFWWGCSGFKETGCKFTCFDKNGKPEL